MHKYNYPVFCLFAVILAACAANEPAPSAGPAEVPPSEADVAVAAAPAEVAEPEAEEGAGAELPVPQEPQYDADDVAWIQQRLFDLGYYEGAVDGSAGWRTKQAIREYQVDQGLEPDGRPTAEFRNFMWRNGG